MAGLDPSGLIPTTIVGQIFQAVENTTSAAMRLGRRLPIPTGKSSIPVAGAAPVAGFVSVGGRKPFTDMQWGMEEIVAEEVACTIAIPQAYIDDVSINLWAYARPQLAEAIGITIDNAVFWGVGAPASYPTGGLVASATVVDPGVDAVDTVSKAMSAVELQGLPVTGHAADIAVRGAFRGLRSNTGSLLLEDDGVATNGQRQALYGVPIAWNQFTSDDYDFITGDWRELIIGVRQDIRYEMSNDGVIVDNAGKVIISAFQDDQVLMRVYARVGCTLLKPVTRRAPGGATPFAVARLSEATGALGVTATPDDTGSDAAAAPVKATPAKATAAPATP